MTVQVKDSVSHGILREAVIIARATACVCEA